MTDNLLSKRIEEITTVISEYARVYSEFEKIQKSEKERTDNSRLLPKGDQKTGVIGEFYSLRYLRRLHKDEEVKLCDNHSEKAIDIEIGNGNFVSVKTVSFFSKKRSTTPIKTIPGTKIELHIISLDENFRPDGYWVLGDIINIRTNRSRKLKVPQVKGTELPTSSYFRENKIEEFNHIVFGRS